MRCGKQLQFNFIIPSSIQNNERSLVVGVGEVITRPLQRGGREGGRRGQMDSLENGRCKDGGGGGERGFSRTARGVSRGRRDESKPVQQIRGEAELAVGSGTRMSRT